MRLERRTFLLGLGAIAMAGRADVVVASNDPLRLLRHSVSGDVINFKGETITIYRPLVLRNLPANVTIKNLCLRQGADFIGDAMIYVRGSLACGDSLSLAN